MPLLVVFAASLLIGDALAQAPPAASDGMPSPSHAASRETQIEARFVAEVKWIEVIGKRKATVVPIGPDPRWLLAIDIVSIEKSEKLFENKGRAVLAIHSPELLFAMSDKEAAGKSYSFKVSGVLRDGRPRYYHAQAKTKTPSGKEQP